MEDLRVLVIAEGNALDSDVPVGQRNRPGGVDLFLAVQDGVYLSHDGAHLGEAVHEVHCRQQRAGNTQGEDDDGDERLHGQAAALVKEPAHGQDGDERRRGDCLGKGNGQLAALHPVVEVGGVGAHALGEFCIGVFPLIERLDDLDAADIFDDGGVHRLRDLYRPLVLLAVVLHHPHHQGHAHGDGDDREQRHAPVEEEQIEQYAHRRQQVGGHFRQQVRQRPLHGLHLIDDNLFHLAARRVHDRAQGHLRQLLQDELADLLEDGKRRFMGHGQRQRVEQGAQAKARQRDKTPCGIKAVSRPPGEQADDDLRRREIGQHAAQHAQRSGDDRPHKAAVMACTQLPEAQHGALFLH